MRGFHIVTSIEHFELVTCHVTSHSSGFTGRILSKFSFRWRAYESEDFCSLNINSVVEFVGEVVRLVVDHQLLSLVFAIVRIERRREEEQVGRSLDD